MADPVKPDLGHRRPPEPRETTLWCGSVQGFIVRIVSRGLVGMLTTVTIELEGFHGAVDTPETAETLAMLLSTAAEILKGIEKRGRI